MPLDASAEAQKNLRSMGKQSIMITVIVVKKEETLYAVTDALSLTIFNASKFACLILLG